MKVTFLTFNGRPIGLIPTTITAATSPAEPLHLCQHGYDQNELCPICNAPEYRRGDVPNESRQEKPC